MKTMQLSSEKKTAPETDDFKELCEKFVEEYPGCTVNPFIVLADAAFAFQQSSSSDINLVLHYLLRRLCRIGITDFEALYSVCNRRPGAEWTTPGVGAVMRARVCTFCQVCNGPCSEKSAECKSKTTVTSTHSGTFEDALQEGLLDKRTYHALLRAYGSVEGLYESCGGFPKKVIKECRNLGERGMDSACKVCKAYLSQQGRECPDMEATKEAKTFSVTQRLIRNVSSAFGVSMEEAERAIRTGSLKSDYLPSVKE